MREIVYAATPFHLVDLTPKICDFIQEQGYFPLHPFNALPLERYNYNNYTREEIMKVCLNLVDLSDRLWIFSIGTGSFDEWLRAG